MTMTRALVLTLLLGAALGNLHCQGPCDQWFAPEELDLGVTDDLHGLVGSDGGFPYHIVTVGSGGVVVRADGLRNAERDRRDHLDLSVERPTTRELLAVLDDTPDIIAVGRGGAVVRPFHGDPILDPGTTADLHALARKDDELIVAGDDVVLSYDLAADRWTPANRPDTGWGPLRAVVTNGGGVFVVGLAGVAWKRAWDDPLAPWQLVDLDTTADLRTGHGDVIAGAGGTVRIRHDDLWIALAGPPDADFIASSAAGTPQSHYLLAADGRVFELDIDAPQLFVLEDLGPDLSALHVHTGKGDIRIFAAGRRGRAVRVNYEACTGVLH